MTLDRIQKIFAISVIVIIVALVAAILIIPAVSNQRRWAAYRDDESKKAFVAKVDEINALSESLKSTNEYLDLGNAYYNLEEYDAAIKAYKKALEVTNNYSPTAYLNIGNVYKRKGEYARAQEAYLKGIEQDPGQTQPYLTLAELYALPWGGKKYDPEQILLKGLSYNNKERNLLINLAIYYKDTGQAEKAVEYYEKAIVANPNNEVAKQELAELKKQYGIE